MQRVPDFPEGVEVCGGDASQQFGLLGAIEDGIAVAPEDGDRAAKSGIGEWNRFKETVEYTLPDMRRELAAFKDDAFEKTQAKQVGRWCCAGTLE